MTQTRAQTKTRTKQVNTYQKYVFETSKKERNRSTNNVWIKTIDNKKDFKKFYNTPWKIYRKNPNWVPPLWLEINRFFQRTNLFWTHAESQLFIAEKNHEVIGRVAAFIDHAYCTYIKRKVGFFGFFECIQDFRYAEALLTNAQNWLASKGMTCMQGPIDGRIDMGCGFLCADTDSPPSILSSYSPQYYCSFAEDYGMKKARDLLIYYIDLTKPIPRQLREKAQQCSVPNVQIRHFNRLRTQRELRWWVNLFRETFSDHWGYVPVSAEEVKSRFGVKQLRWFVDPPLFLVAERSGVPVAYIWSTPDYNQVIKKMNGRLGPFQLLRYIYMRKRINKGKMHLIGIKKEVRKHHLGSLLNYLTLVEMQNRGYIGAEVGLIDEKNAAAHATITITSAKPQKIYRVFEKNITCD